MVGVAAEYNSASKYVAPSTTVINTPVTREIWWPFVFDQEGRR